MENFVQSAKQIKIIPSSGCLFVCFELLWGCLICCSEFYCVRRWTLVHRLTHRSEQDLHWNNDPIANNTSYFFRQRLLECYLAARMIFMNKGCHMRSGTIPPSPLFINGCQLIILLSLCKLAYQASLLWAKLKRILALRWGLVSQFAP